MERKDFIRIWAPEASFWSVWAKPVLFTGMHYSLDQEYPEVTANINLSQIAIASPSTAIVVDLPGADSVLVGYRLAKEGYRPVPLYNACMGSSAVVDVESIQKAIRFVSRKLNDVLMSDDAPPAFLIDSKRMSGIPTALSFDNRSIMFPQDFPSATTLLSRGIKEIILLQAAPAVVGDDLMVILQKWKQGGLNILAMNAYSGIPSEPLQISKPFPLKAFLYFLFAVIGLRRSSAGGFGAVVPDPNASSGSGYYYGGGWG